VWADFARGRLADRGNVPGVLRYARARAEVRTPVARLRVGRRVTGR
jgi:hypothetical protein